MVLFLALTFMLIISLRLAALLLDRVCRYCRLSLLATSDQGTNIPDIDVKAEELKATLDTMRREEAIYATRYDRRCCSSDDLVRATSLRVLAEVALFRHQTSPRSWAETCRRDLAET